MRLAARIAAGVLVAGLAVGGVAVAATGPETVAVEADTTTYTVGDAGEVTLRSDGGTLTLMGIDTRDGWTATIDSETPREIEIDFVSDGVRLRFNAELEDGMVDVDVEQRTGATVDTTVTTTLPDTDMSTTASTVPTTTSTTTSTTVADAPGDTSGATTHQVRDAGTVTVRTEGSSLVLVDVTTNPGWSASIDSQTDREIEIDFFSGGVRLRFNAELEDGSIDIDIEQREGGSPTPDTTTPTTIDDDQDDDDVDDGAPAGGVVEPGTRTYTVANAGTVTIDVTGSGLQLITITPNPGWSFEVDEADSSEVRVEFERDDTEAELRVELKADGELRVRIEND